MSKFRCGAALVAPLLIFASSAWSQTPAAGRLRAGAAKVDITPKETELALPSDFIRDPLYARAIVVSNGASCAVLVGLDQGGANNNVVSDAVTRAAAVTKCPAANFIISATHTHSGNTQGLGGGGAPTAKTVADAIVSAVTTANSRLAPARIGFGTTSVNLNVNRDLFNSKQEWRQAANLEGPSDKTLSVIEFIGEDFVPIGVYMNYAMHPINFYLSGVLSADFPGEASRYIEDLYAEHTVAIFSQGASGDQNPWISERPYLRSIRIGAGPLKQDIGGPLPPGNLAVNPPASSINPVNEMTALVRKPVPAQDLPAYRKEAERTGKIVTTEGLLIAQSAVQIMRDQIRTTDTAKIWGGEDRFTCPGRDRLDAANPVRENANPGYKEGADVNLMVGVLRLGDIHFVRVNGEVYSQISMHLKEVSPAKQTIMVTLANGGANSGYIYSDAAASHLTFQVISSRLKPGCAETSIISRAVELLRKSDQ